MTLQKALSVRQWAFSEQAHHGSISETSRSSRQMFVHSVPQSFLVLMSSQASLGSTGGLPGSWKSPRNSLIHRLLQATLQRENTTSLQSQRVLLRDSSSPPHRGEVCRRLKSPGRKAGLRHNHHMQLEELRKW